MATRPAGSPRSVLDPDVGLPQHPIEAALDGCVRGGRDGIAHNAGRQVFRVTNSTALPVEITVDGADGTVFGEIEGLGPQSTRSLDVVLGNGSYHFSCKFEDTPTIDSVPFAVVGATVSSNPGAVPVTTQDLTGPTLAYEAWVNARLPDLVASTTALRDAVAGGSTTDARAAWVAAHHRYETLGAAYGAFGDLDGAVNGTAPIAADTAPEFTGFHRLEQGLWHGESPASLVPVADQLVTDVAQLATEFAATHVDPLDVGLRAHEIMENTLRFELTGRTDYGSHTGLDTVAANLEGTRELLDVLTPILRSRYPQLPGVMAQLAAAHDLVHTLDGRYRYTASIPDLPTADRQRVDAAVSGLTEVLAPVAAICDVRRAG